MNAIRSRLRESPVLWIGLGMFVLTILYVNPIRETGLDDDWLYALMVRDLLKTGSYQPHAWSAANLPFQTYYGSIFALCLGYSFTSLRVSTLVLVFVGLIAFYHLAREHRLNDTQAGLSMVALFASPLVLRYSFNFNTDVPFLMCLIIALLLYTRALRQQSYPLMMLASVAASAAILTRQFGMALPAALVSLWILSKKRRAQALFVGAGVALPSMAAVWQFSLGMSAPTKIQERELHNTAAYLADAGALLTNTVLFRPTVILHYLALFSLPFALLALVALAYEIKRPGDLGHADRGTARVLLAACTVYIVAGITQGRVVHHLSRLMPYVYWEFANIGASQRAIMTLVTASGAIVYAGIFVRRYFPPERWRRVPQSERLLDLVSLFLLAQQLVYYKFGDRYLIVFLPFALIVVGRHLGGWLDRLKVPVAIACVSMLVASAMWARALLAKNEAEWGAAERIQATGVESQRIFGLPEWNFYYGAIGDYLADLGDAELPPNLDDFWHRWYQERMKRAQFVITTSAAGDGAEAVDEVPYRDALFRDQHVRVLKRAIESRSVGGR
jgi:4-amino-4-deoxy-L-arabinose transferase-like glycosyltransferase